MTTADVPVPVPGTTVEEEAAKLREKATRLIALLDAAEYEVGSWYVLVGNALNDLASHAPGYTPKIKP